MRVFFFSLLSLIVTTSLNVWAQTSYTQSAPISISAEGLAGEVGEDEETMRARSELAASKIKATEEEKKAQQEEPKQEIAEEIKEEVVKEEPVEEKIVAVATPPVPVKNAPKIDWDFDWKERQRTIFFKFGFLNSSWDKVSPELKNGSTILGVGLNQSLSNSFSFGISLDFHHFQEGSLVPEEIRILGLRFEPQFLYPLHKNISLLGSFGLMLADSNIRKKIQSNSTTETYRVFSNGTAFALSPGFGMRTYFSSDVYFDLVGEYQFFVGKPEKYYGGLAGSFRLHLSL